ncbi:tRNA pseudouridine synthase A [Pseudolycoriella hygida]|uniref:Pseudouridylate synthase 1 homolog n=1 Tax=Pseudolycoriella hygida TaxID=35572 RepID=A0A9Q0RVQ5_9DIPT|nr:tRNA pseudouridine synthase A [Pseudolycoriella hygida]
MLQLKQVINKPNFFKVQQCFPVVIQKRHESNPKLETEKGPKHPVNHCLLMGYAGFKYYGMEYQKTVETVEQKLFNAMLENKWITKSDYYKTRRIRYEHASRTDSGVSAARQCCSLFLPVGVNVQELNSKLPDDIRVFGLKQVVSGFHARYYCRSRTYTYTLPSIAFSHYNDQASQREYRLSSDKLKLVNELLQLYKGLLNFHNFTIKKLYSDKLSRRKMLHLECTPPFLVDDVEFCVIRIQGSSFMMHQIRKMIGFFLAVVRGVIDKSLFDLVFTDRIINCPTAPGLGLVLESLSYEDYNKHYSGIYEALTWEEYDEDVKQFHEKFIQQSIVQTEIRDEITLQWVEQLLNYPYIPVDGDITSNIHKAYI